MIERVQGQAGKNDLKELDIRELITKYSETLFTEIADIFNYVFSYQNDEYQPVTAEWVEDNLTFSVIGEIVVALADVNQMGWLIPLFKERAGDLFRSALAKVDNPEKKTTLVKKRRGRG